MTDQTNETLPDDPHDNLNIGLWIISFLIPIVGAVIYFSNKSERPKKARSACYAALIGIGVGLVINILIALTGASS